MIQYIRATTRYISGKIRSTDRKYDTERGQALVRLVLIPIYSLHFLVVSIISSFLLFDNFLFVSLYIIYLATSTWIFIWVTRNPGFNFPRRLIAFGADYVIITASLAVGEHVLLPVYAVLLWVTVGYGIRYGSRYLVAATIIALGSLTITAVLNPYWRANIYVPLTLALTTILVPSYILSLLSRLQAAYDAALEANLAKSRFLAQASHDLRQPIHAMSLFTAILRDAGLNDEQQSLVDSIDRSVDSLGRLFRSLLDISTLDSGSVQPKPQAVAIGDILREVVHQNAQMAQWAGVDLRLVPNGYHVQTDPTLVTTIVQNIVSNALKYAPGRPVLIGCRRKGASLAIQVHDRGDGIAAHHLPLLFNEFYRVRERGDRDVDGVGLGLAIVKRMAGLMDLNVTIESIQGRGTSVTISGLPLAESVHSGEIATRDLPERQKSLLEGMRIVLVEDDVDVLDATCTLLQKWGCIVQAEKALPATVMPCDLIITDYDLGSGITGSDCIAHLRSLVGHEAPAIVLTGHDVSRIREDLSDQAIPILSKPVRPTELRLSLIGTRLKVSRLTSLTRRISQAD
ncbi:hybrid sensor histidine kinase/response regulator [Sphingomonas sp. DT-204]|uniref:hybrid sensor histidine kinase/response regulator n=1 Tax=Sphingomonas sp. DT-204 TaxID=3396166 RepID=UPI003F19CEEA